MGLVKFWDTRTSTQLNSIKAHEADVLCLAVGSVCLLLTNSFWCIGS